MKENRVIGYDFLRIILSFFVVMSHFWTWDQAVSTDRIVVFFRDCAVPVFMALAFYFSHDYIRNPCKDRIKRRIQRIAIPHIAWGGGGFFIMNVMYLAKEGRARYGYGDLILQVLFGDTTINGVLWFQFDLIVITLMFYFINRVLGDKKGKISLIIISVTGGLFVLSRWHYLIWTSLSCKLPERAALMRLPEMVAYASLGLALKEFLILEKFGKLSIRTKALVELGMFFMAVAVWMIEMWYDLKNFGYGYAYQMILTAFMLLFFYSQTVSKKWAKKIKAISKYTMGIYCTHLLVGRAITGVLEITASSFLGGIPCCVVIWSTSLFLCAFLAKLPFSWLKKAVM